MQCFSLHFWVPSHRFNSATGEQKGITQTIYTDSEPPSRLPISLMPSAKVRSANLPFLRLWCDAVGDRTPASRTTSGRSNHYATQGRYQIKEWGSNETAKGPTESNNSFYRFYCPKAGPIVYIFNDFRRAQIGVVLLAQSHEVCPTAARWRVHPHRKVGHTGYCLHDFSVFTA